MKHGIICSALALLFLFLQAPETRGGGFLGQLSTAEAVPQGAVDLGAYFGFYDDANALFGQFRLGLFQHAEWEVKSGILDNEGGSDPNFMIGTAFKYHFHHRHKSEFPDMAFSAILEYYDFGTRRSLWILGGGLIGSYPFKLSNNSHLTPYGRLCIRAERVKGGKGGNIDWDYFDIGLNLGAQYAPSKRVQLYGEFQMDDQFGFIAGVNFAVH